MSAKLEAVLKEFKFDATVDRPFYVIYLDDEADSLEIISGLFERLNFKCLATSSPTQALAWARLHAPDLAFVLSDFRMPEMDGFEFRRQILGANAPAPFVIYSGHVDTEMALRGIDLKIAGFLEKPLDLEKFYELIEKDVLPRVGVIREDRELLAAFVAETEELLEQSEDLILELDGQTQDLDPLNRFFGIVHTIKGASSFFEPKHLHRFAHAFEDVLKDIQRGTRKLNPEVTSFFLFSMDTVKELLGEFKTGEYREHDTDQLIAAAMAHLEGESTEAEEADADGPAPAGDHVHAKAAAKPRQNEIKVALTTLDEFMQLSGEMTVVRNMLNKSLRAIEKQFPGDREVANLSELLEELHKVNGSVQSKVTELRKVSMRNVLKPLPRAVRDIAKQLGKSIELILVGEQLRVDTSIAEVLGNGLLHVVKNSIDHGIETTEGRASAGKVAGGRITLTCSEKNEHVIIVVEDDGKGINTDAIRKKLRANASHSEAQMAAMSDAELHGMIFEAGFSTAQQVTDISGRGVGMSMVKDLVQGAGGTIDIHSRAGLGTKFTFSIPVPKSVLITSCLFVRTGLEQFGIMRDDISRSLQITPDQRATRLSRLEGGYCLNVDGEVIPVVDIARLLGAPSSSPLEDPHRDLHLVVTGSANFGRRTALCVDEILDVEDTVIKALAPQFNPHGLYRGATFMDDGTVGLILDMSSVLERSGGATRQAPAPRPPPVVEVTNEQPYMVFELGIPGRYAVAQELIFRVEELDLRKSHSLGQFRVCSYRGGALSILNLESHLHAAAATTPSDAESSVVIVIKTGDQLFGFPVRSIIDVISSGPFTTGAIPTNRYLAGQNIWNESVVNLVDWSAIVTTVAKLSA